MIAIPTTPADAPTTVCQKFETWRNKPASPKFHKIPASTAATKIGLLKRSIGNAAFGDFFSTIAKIARKMMPKIRQPQNAAEPSAVAAKLTDISRSTMPTASAARPGKSNFADPRGAVSGNVRGTTNNMMKQMIGIKVKPMRQLMPIRIEPRTLKTMVKMYSIPVH